MIHITYDDAVRYLREAVAERGADYVYIDPEGIAAGGGAGCMYVHGDEPGCIVGNVMDRAGVSLDVLSEFEFTNAPALFDGVTALRPAALPPIVSGDQRTIDLLSAAQTNQDAGFPWGEAVARALNVPSTDEEGA